MYVIEKNVFLKPSYLIFKAYKIKLVPRALSKLKMNHERNFGLRATPVD